MSEYTFRSFRNGYAVRPEFAWSVRNHRRTLRQIRALRVKVVIHFVQHDVIDLNGLSAAVENQSELVIIEIDFIQKDVDDGTTVKRIIKVGGADKILD